MKILLVDDDEGLAKMVANGLVSDGHAVDVAHDGGEGLFLAKAYMHDLIILDYSMPKKDGLEICREIRSIGKTTPIIFLSVNDEVPLKVQALESGADDYMTKPFSIDELRARIKAVTRRPESIRSPVITLADVSLDTESQIVTRQGRIIKITRKEFCLLEYLMRNAGTVLSRAMIMEHVWTADSDLLSNTVESHIRNLRKKINAGGLPELIINISGRGYVMDTPENLKKFA